MPDLKLVEQLAELYGVSGEYDDWAGNPVSVPTVYKIPLLQAMGLDVDDDSAISRTVEHVQQQDWEQLLPPVVVLHQGQPFTLPLHIPSRSLKNTFKGDIQLENGDHLPLTVDTDSLTVEETKTLQGKDFARLNLPLPEDLCLGYHRLLLKGKNLKAHSLLIVAPTTCYEPESLRQGQKHWGASIQLYTVRTEKDWGMGDFSSLKLLAAELAKQGAHIIGLNPIHSLYPSNPLHTSPYSPSSRNFINPLYIDITAVPDFEECVEAQARVESQDFKNKRQQARSSEHVDYALVASLKFDLLNILYEHFCERHIKKRSAKAKAFNQFCEAKGSSLECHALYESIYEHYKSLDINSWGWPCWEDNFQNPDSNAVKEFANINQQRIRYYMFLQWLAETQLEEAQQAAIDAGMEIGIYRDLAVGVDRGGADVWSNRSVYCLEAGVGAPPDGVAPQGQSWGLPPFNPLTLKKDHYAPFIEMVRSNMSHCGALRIDHVMGLLRLWWCPAGKTADFGAYVYYPLDDLLGIIKLESLRRQCLLFGEDLGTVPPEIEAALPPALFYSNEVVLFSCEGERFTAPEKFKTMALTCISNHDIPTLKAWWNCLDLDLRLQLGIYDKKRTQQEKEARHQDKIALLNTMIDTGEQPWGMSPEDINSLGYSRDFMEKAHYFLAKTASKIVVLQLEDVLQVEPPVNIPGTSEEYPNWRRKLTDTLENLFADESNQAFFRNMSVIRES